MHLSLICFLKEQINTDCYLKAILIAVQAEDDGRVSKLPSPQNKHIFLWSATQRLLFYVYHLFPEVENNA